MNRPLYEERTARLLRILTLPGGPPATVVVEECKLVLLAAYDAAADDLRIALRGAEADQEVADALAE